MIAEAVLELITDDTTRQEELLLEVLLEVLLELGRVPLLLVRDRR